MTTILTASRTEDLSAQLYGKIKKDLEEGLKVILVVPAQSTLSAEKKAFDVFNAEGFFRLRIIRGQKLYEEILKQTGFPGLVSINTIGKNMLLRKIAAEIESEFSAFGGIVRESGFLDMAGDFIIQLKQNKISEDEYKKLVSFAGEGSLFFKKLSDMKLIYDKYNQAMLGKFTDSEDLLSYVTSKVKDCPLISESKIYYSDFYSFTNNEIAFLSELDRCSKGLSISLLSGTGERYNAVNKTVQKLKSRIPGCIAEIAGEGGNEVFSDISEENIHIVRCAGPFTQAQSIASEIKRLVREKNYEYKDIAVLTGNSPSMQGILKRVFVSLDIPVFADEKRSVLHNKGAEAILSLLDIACGDFRTSDIIRFCKADAVDISDDDLDLFCTYLKHYHIRSKAFNTPFRYGKDRFGYAFEKLERQRKTLSELLLPFRDEIVKAETVSEKTRVLYDFLEEKLHFSKRLEKKCITLADEGFVDAAEEYSQVFDAVIGLFDQMAELIGDTKLDICEYGKILSSSFTDIKVGVLPQAEGKVSLGTIGRSLSGNIKALFVAGFNDGIIPGNPENTGILTLQELDTAAKEGFVLAKPLDTVMDEELFSIYRALDFAGEYVWMGYCVSDAEGHDLKPSFILSEIKAQYPGVREESDIANRNDELSYFEGRKLAENRLSEVLRNSLSAGDVPEIWKESYNDIKDDISCVRSGLEYKNTHKALGKDMAKKLFSRDGEYSLSPSRMDSFAACPFKHYVHYGLMPDEPREFGVGGSEVGTVYHEALLRLCSRITDWNSVTDEDIEKYIDEILNNLSEEILDGVLVMGKAQLYTSKRLRQVCIKFAKHMAEQIRSERISSMFLETSFGRGKPFPAVEISTAAGKVYVEGRIDRVDVCRREDGSYIRVVDYKSGSTRFDRKLIEKGLSLQLMVYLEGALGNYPGTTDGGIYYFNIREPQIASDIESIPTDEIAKNVLDKIDREYRLCGMDVDEEFIAGFTNTLSDICEKLALGQINATPKKIGSTFDSCAYCEYGSICQKDIY